MREATRHRLPSKESLKSAAWAAREIPLASKSVDKINLTLMKRPASATNKGINIGDYLLAHELDSGVILLGTNHLTKKFTRSFYKPIDATFKICPKMYHQVLLFMAQVMMRKKNMTMKKTTLIPLVKGWEPTFLIRVFCKHPKMVICVYYSFSDILISNFVLYNLIVFWYNI